MGNASTAVLKEKVLAAFAECGVVTHACKTVGVPRRTFNYWQKHDRKFYAAYELAQQEAIDALEFEARKRAIKCSDLLLIFMLKAARPEKYRESFDGGGYAPHASRDENLQSIQGKLARLAARHGAQPVSEATQ